MTLFFLGDVPTDRLAGLWSDVQAKLSGARAPVLCIAQAGAFPERGRERVLWLGVQEESEGRLEFLHQGTLAAVRRAGFDPRRTGQGEHRPYHAHVTVGRPRGRRTRVPAAFYDLAPRLPWTPTEVALLESVRAASGPRVYEPRERLALGVG